MKREPSTTRCALGIFMLCAALGSVSCGEASTPHDESPQAGATNGGGSAGSGRVGSGGSGGSTSQSGGSGGRNSAGSGGRDTGTDPIGALNLVPLPNKVTPGNGYLALSNDTRFVSTDSTNAVADQLAKMLRRSTGYALNLVPPPAQAGDIEFSIDGSLSTLGNEGYRLEVNDDRVRLSAANAAGLFYATVTLRQLLPPSVEAQSVQSERWELPRLVIEDAPRFAWRGYSFDVARHFFGVEEMKRQIDFAAYHKLNRFHLHLTDDQGFRIEIKSWPKLTEIGGSTQVGGGPGGFFTQTQYQDLVQYAAERFVTIVPEIDMPGHTQAALASYAELNPDNKAKELYTGTKVGISTLWFDGEVTYKFVDDVLREVSSLTPGAYIHVGGDEAPGTDRTKYRAFVKSVAGILKKYGKSLAGWCEVGEAELNPGSLLQDWHEGCVGSVTGAAKGLQVIASPAKHAYLDMKYNATMTVGHNWAGYVEVKNAYEWQPKVPNVPDNAIAGVEAALWTEFISTREHIDFMVFPRLCGHAEIGWSAAEGRNFEEYRTRLAHHGRRLAALGIAFYKSPQIDWLE